jgi:hypothetical protein
VQALAADAASMATSKPRPHPRDGLVEFIRSDPLGDHPAFVESDAPDVRFSVEVFDQQRRAYADGRASR